MRGFTLIELIVVVSIAAIALTIGVPGFSQLIQNNRIASQSNDLVSTLHFARSEATKRGMMVSVCGSSDGLACHGGTSWASGWIVFVDTDGNGALDASDTNTDDEDQNNKVLRVFGALSGNTVLTAPSAVTYMAPGQVVTGASLELTLSTMSVNLARCISVSQIGRVSSESVACS